jgi:hypothetical protein
MLVAGTQSDFPLSLFSRIDPITTKVFWWWGSTTRLDTAVVVADSRPGSFTAAPRDHVRELVTAEVAVEVAGPDLQTAATIAQRWDGRMSSLKKLLAEISYPVNGAEAIIRRSIFGARQPPSELAGLWNAGAVDLWDGQVRITPAASNVSSESLDVDTLIWRGQSRALTPLIDDQRRRLENEVRQRIDPALLDSLLEGEGANRRLRSDSQRSSSTVLEVGQLAWLIRSGHVKLSRSERDLVNRLREARNAIAHLRGLTDDELDELTRFLPG